MGKRVMILSASVGSGHNMAAAALEEQFARAAGVAELSRLDVLEKTNDIYRSFYDDAYFKLVDAVPWLVGWGYDISDPPFKLGNSASVWDRLNTTAVVRAIKAYAPDTVVCTHFLPTRLISLMITRGVLDCTLSAVTTDYDFAGLWLSSPFSRYFVAREETAAFMTAVGVPADRITTSGIPVRNEIGAPLDRTAVLARFGLTAGTPVLLISAGASGGSYTTSIIRQTLRMSRPFQAVVVCGRNARLQREIERLVAHRGRQYRVLGFTTEMADLMRAADLFIGKPGGLSSSEAMAAGLPMALIQPIPGQEDRNSDYLLEEGAAVRCNYETTVGHKVDTLLSDPARIARMAASARRIGRPQAAATIVDAVLAQAAPMVWISRAARASILRAYQDGVSTADLNESRSTRTLVNPESEASVGVLTADQVSWLAPLQAHRYPGDRRLTISTERLGGLRRQGANAHLLATLRQVIGTRSELALDVG